MGIQSVERAIDIINEIASQRVPLGLPELSHALNLPKTTIHTIVKTLREKDFLLQDPVSKKYGLGFAVFELGMIQVSELAIQRAATSVLDQLANNIGAECRLGLWHQNSVIITLTAHPIGTNRLTRQMGPRIPAYCTALGKALLSFLPEEQVSLYLNATELVGYTDTTITDRKKLENELAAIRKTGFSMSDGELISYRSAIGAPVFGAGEKLEGAISIALDAQQKSKKMIEQLSEHLLRTAHELSLDLGYPAIRGRVI